MAIVAIDQGTSGTKALVIGDSGEVLSRGYGALDLEHGAPGVSECTADNLWQSIVIAVKQALAGSTEKISAVGLANQGESILAWDKSNGDALSKVIIWQDSRSASLCDERRAHSELVLSKSGLALDPYFVAPKMVWLRERVKTGVITTTDTWIIARLTGKFVTDVSTASRTLLFDLHTRSWSTELADIWGLSIGDFPELINNDAIIGEICHPDLEQLRGVILAGAMVDQPAALLAENCFEVGQAKCTYGTGAFLLTNIGASPKISKHGLATSLAWNIRGQSAYYLDGQVFTAATAVQWLIDNDLLVSAEAIDSLPDARGVTEDGKVSLEHIECNAACDYAPVVMANWEFYDNQTVESAKSLVDGARAGNPPAPTRGPNKLVTYKQASAVLAGLDDGLAREGVQAGEPTLLGLKLSKEGK